jgi:1H-pyrrole-2-carbonyl-[peptidyl-carrier protein] brominase
MKTDVLILGGGPGGTAAAMFLISKGIKPTILEQAAFPRFHIGESMTGEAGQVLNRLGLNDQMTKARHQTKHGVRVFGAQAVNSWYVPVSARDENWELRPGTTWQVRRSEFDAMMLREAEARGATVLRGRATKPLMGDEGGLRGLTVQWPDGGVEDIETELVLDCSGLATFLANHRVTGPKYLGSYDKQIAFFTHVTGAIRDPDTAGECAQGNTLIFYKEKYHWAWFIPIDNEVVSLGLVLPTADFVESKKSPEEFFRTRIPDVNPELKRRLVDMKPVESVHVIPNYSYQVRRFCGKGFICIGDSHRFIDPIFSFGLSATLREAEFALPHICDYLEGKGRDKANPFSEHQVFCERANDNLEDMIDMFWEKPFAFATFVHQRYRPELIDAFAGRVYPTERQPSSAILTFRKMLNRTRDYTGGDEYSVPIGSRFHPERAPLWEPDSSVSTTEDWSAPQRS